MTATASGDPDPSGSYEQQVDYPPPQATNGAAVGRGRADIFSDTFDRRMGWTEVTDE